MLFLTVLAIAEAIFVVVILFVSWKFHVLWLGLIALVLLGLLVWRIISKVNDQGGRWL